LSLERFLIEKFSIIQPNLGNIIHPIIAYSIGFWPCCGTPGSPRLIITYIRELTITGYLDISERHSAVTRLRLDTPFTHIV
jgi:hypothetical protein